MNITTLSKSGYEKTEECPLKYFISYVLKHKEPSIWKATPKGSIVHLVLEILAQISKAVKIGQGTVQTDIGEINTTSYNLLSIITACYDKIAVDDQYINWDREEDLSDCIKWVNKALDYEGGAYDPRNLNIIDIEKEFKIEIMKPWAVYDFVDVITKEKKQGFFSMNGVIDLVTEIGPNLYHIVDYKTGKRRDWAKNKKKEYEDMASDIQLQMYYWAAKQLYPNKDILVTIFYINDGGTFTIAFHDSNLDEIELKLQRKYMDMTKGIPRANRSYKCKWCHYSKVTSTDVGCPSITEFRQGRHAGIGDTMSLCDAVEYALSFRDESTVIENMSNISRFSV